MVHPKDRVESGNVHNAHVSADCAVDGVMDTFQSTEKTRLRASVAKLVERLRLGEDVVYILADVRSHPQKIRVDGSVVAWGVGVLAVGRGAHSASPSVPGLIQTF